MTKNSFCAEMSDRSDRSDINDTNDTTATSATNFTIDATNDRMFEVYESHHLSPRATIKAHPATLHHPRPYGSMTRLCKNLPLRTSRGGFSVTMRA